MRVSGKIATAVLLTGLLAGCTTYDADNAVIGGAAGAVVGAIAGRSVAGAVVGAAVGATAGVLIGRIAEGSEECYYRDNRGRRYVDDCPD